MGTSSMPLGVTVAGPAPVGITSGWAISLVCSLTALSSGSWPTLKRTMASAYEGPLVV
jgi:hypothetical protein